MTLSAASLARPAEGPFPARAAACLAAAFPAAVLLYERAGGAILHVLCLLAILALALPRYQGRDADLRSFISRHGIFCAAMLAPLIAAVLSQLPGGTLQDAFASNVQRLALAPLALWLLLQAPPRWLRHVQWGFVAGALAASATLFFLTLRDDTRPDPDSLNLLNYANILILLGCFALCSLGWQLTRRPKLEAGVKLVAFAASGCGVVLSQSKGPLLVFGALVLLCLFWLLRPIPLRWRLAAAAAALIACAAVTLQVDRFRQDAQAAVAIAVAVARGAPADDVLEAHGAGSVSVRLGLWRAAWEMFLAHPWTGVGNKQFDDGLARLSAQGQVPKWAAWRPDRTPFTQAHNEVFNVLATTGLAGALALAAVYGVPLACFVRRCRSGPQQARVAAFMGVVLCVGFMLAGATVSLFPSTTVATFYGVMCAVFLALSGPGAADPNAGRRPVFYGGWVDGLLRRLYKRTHGRAWRHNRHLWPYVRVRRGPRSAIEAVWIAGAQVPTVELHRALASLAREQFHLILSGPSVKDIDYTQLKVDAAMGVNGAIALCPPGAPGPVAPRFTHYCIIDANFVFTRPALVRQVLSSDLLLFVTPEVLRYIVQQQGVDAMRCRLCVIENIAERAYEAAPGPSDLAAWQQAGRDVAVFDARQCLGVSFDPDLGFFDADTVAYAALQVLAWGGVRRVIIHGLDISGATTSPRFYESQHDRATTRLERNFASIIEPSFRQAAPLLAARGVELVNLSPSSAIPAEVIARADWRSLSGRCGGSA